jgi:MATE family multidrug resistance protein
VTGLFTTWSLIALFQGTAGYLTTFVAQYHGAGRPRRVGPAIWQGVYFSIAAGLLVAALSPLAASAFGAAGHPADVRAAEVTYSTILMRGALPTILMATLSTFFSGRGETRVVLAVNVGATALDSVLNYAWIFGRWGFPEHGRRGRRPFHGLRAGRGRRRLRRADAARAHRAEHATLSGFRFERALFVRLLRYGLPTGLQVATEVLAFGLFMLIVGRLGTAPLAASSIAFSLNMIVFLPMLGLGVGVSSLVGRYLGADDPPSARRATWSAFWMSLAYFAACGAVYVLLPRPAARALRGRSGPGGVREVERLTIVLLRFVALYSIFDMMNVCSRRG